MCGMEGHCNYVYTVDVIIDIGCVLCMLKDSGGSQCIVIG